MDGGKDPTKYPKLYCFVFSLPFYEKELELREEVDFVIISCVCQCAILDNPGVFTGNGL